MHKVRYMEDIIVEVLYGWDAGAITAELVLRHGGTDRVRYRQ